MRGRAQNGRPSGHSWATDDRPVGGHAQRWPGPLGRCAKQDGLGFSFEHSKQRVRADDGFQFRLFLRVELTFRVLFR